ncbi:hypothetical protein MMC27_007729 [Xylographa pallens]|nr:hypothetical protein [Xylographa pallens]
MAPDYTKHKNAELEQLLRARSLPHTGKKADLIARLVQDDSEKAPPSASAPSSGPGIAADDEIDWDDDAAKGPAPSTETPALPPLPAHAGAGRAANPLAVPNQVPAIDPAATHDLTVTQPSIEPSIEPPSTSPPAPSPLPAGPALPPVSVESELAKRLARARKYNLPAEAVFEAEKALERFKKFGTVAAAVGPVGGLEGALPERAKGMGKRGRGEAEEEGEKEKGAKRVDSRRREGRGGGRGRSGDRKGRGKSGERSGRGKSGERSGRGRSKELDGVKKGGEGVGEKDRLAAEARKARFGAL